ncbi:hypothetical protein [Streptomyces sp. TE33382]
MPSSPDRFRIKRAWRRLAGDSNKQVPGRDTAVNTDAPLGNTPQIPHPAAGIAFPPLLIVPGTPGYAALALMLAPVALWTLTVWLTSRSSTTTR